MAKQIKYGRYLHGGDYNPEQWLDRPDILQKDIEYFKKAHINTVSVGIFSWAVLEPEEGKYNFDWLEEIINNLYKEGIHTILATPSGARPKWMADKYEEVLRMDPDRTRRFFGGRHNHCFTSPVYREKVHAIDKKLAERFGKHPAVMLWHISNEFGGECHCPLCQAKFREWLKEKYGTIENLNKRWCTTFWSHIYNSFDQIESPSAKGENELHALKLDWKRFVTDQTIDFIKNEVDAIREGGSELPVTANLMYDYDGLDYKKFKDVLDIKEKSAATSSITALFSLLCEYFLLVHRRFLLFLIMNKSLLSSIIYYNYFEINYLLSDIYTKDHSSLMADKMLVFFNSDFAYTVKIKYIIAKTTTNASRNSHGNTNVMQWFTASNRLQTIALKMLPNTRAITNEPPR